MKETKLQSELEKRLQTENVMCMGFGLAYKSVMLDREISAQAKCLYLTICAYAGNDAEAYPSRGALLRDTGLSYAAYYIALHQLTAAGLIHIRRERRKNKRWHHNVYSIVQRPGRYAACLTEKGFGQFPRAAARDQRLRPRAKALYGLLAAFAGNSVDRSACPSVSAILHYLGIGQAAYYTACHELQACGYLTIQRQHINGHVTGNRYVLNEYAGAAHTPVRQHFGFEFIDSESADREFCVLGAITKSSLTKNRSTKNITQEKRKEGASNLSAAVAQIRENIDYEIMKTWYNPFRRRVLDEIVDLMAETVTVERSTVRVNRAEYPFAMVKERILSVTSDAMERIMDSLERKKTESRNLRAYLLTTIFNAPAFCYTSAAAE